MVFAIVSLCFCTKTASLFLRHLRRISTARKMASLLDTGSKQVCAGPSPCLEKRPTVKCERPFPFLRRCARAYEHVVYSTTGTLVPVPYCTGTVCAQAAEKNKSKIHPQRRFSSMTCVECSLSSGPVVPPPQLIAAAELHPAVLQ